MRSPGSQSSVPELSGAFPPAGFIPWQSKIEGIEVYVPADTLEKVPELVDFKCPKCGASIAYNVQAGKLTCDYCGYSEVPDPKRLGRAAEGFEFKVETITRSENGWGEARKELACQRCGGVVSTRPDAIAFTCPFCGSNKVLFREPLEDVLRPRYLIPFKIKPETCRQITERWLGSSWMVPTELRKITEHSPDALGKYNPLYIPYWTFSATCNAIWKAQVAHETVEHHFVDGKLQEYRRVTWKEESGKLQKTYADLLVPGTTRLNLKALGQVDNYKVDDLVLYEPDLLAGMQAQAYNLPLENAWDTGRQVMRDHTRKACLDRVSSTNMRGFTMSLDFNDESWRYILTPVYTNVYQYNNKVFQVLINGQTGQIAGPRPVDWDKVWIVFAAMLSPGLLSSLIGWLFSSGETGQIALGFGLFLLIVACVIGFFILRQALEMEHV